MTTTDAIWTDQQRKLIFSTVATGLSAADQAMFEAVCRSSGLDPLRKEIYAVSRGGRMSIQTGIDGYLKLANSTQQLDGMDVLYYDTDGIESEVWLRKEPPTACLVRVYRKGCAHPFAASCRFDAYSQRNQMWQKFPETMLAKCTTTLALRRAFADVISGIASADEMDQADMADAAALSQGTPLSESEPAPSPEPARKTPVANNVKPARVARAASAIDAQAQALADSFDGQVVETAAAVETEELPEKDDLVGAVKALYRLAQKSGVTPTGWSSLERQCGQEGISAAKAIQILNSKALEDPAKVANLNKGLATTGAKI